MVSGESGPRGFSALFLLDNSSVFFPSGDFQDDMTDSLRDYTNLPEAALLTHSGHVSPGQVRDGRGGDHPRHCGGLWLIR